VLTLEGIDGESIVLDGNWIEKLRIGNSRARNPISSYKETQVKDFTRRKKVFFGEKEELIQITVVCQNFMSLIVPAERRADVEGFVAALDEAKAAAAE
jgi:hypothetical protein